MNAIVFHKAVADGDATRVKFLINIGQQARVNQPNKQGFTALQQSSKDGRIDVVHVLLNHGADINGKGRKDRTALHLAATGGYADIVELLIKSFADLTVKDGEGMLPEDVGKTEEIADLLCAAHAEQKAKRAPSNRKKSVNSAEEWSQNFTSLPAGSRNSMVSNSSSDSGVFTEESVTSSRSGGAGSDSRMLAPSWRNGANRGGSVGGETRAAMEVLNELEEGHERSASFTAANVTAKPRPKLRRSMSARLPSRRARPRSTQGGRRNNVSEELSALNLSRVASTRSAVDGAATCQCSSSNESAKNVDRDEPRSCDTSVGSPNNDLDICIQAREVESERISTGKCETYETRSQPRSATDSVVCYAGGDEGCVVDEPDEVLPTTTSGRTLREIPEKPVRAVDLRKGWDDAEVYRRSLPRKARNNSRRRTVEVGQVSHENQGLPVKPNYRENYSSYDNNNNNRSTLTRKHGSFRGIRTIAFEPEPNPNCNADIASLNYTTCNTITAHTETKTEQFYRSKQELNRLKQLHYPGGCYEDYNENVDYGDSVNVYRDSCNNIPGYEETLDRLRYKSAKLPAARQISHV